jgi:hypothetical protein
MPSSLMYQEEMFVILETDQEEKFLTPEELLDKLKIVLQNYPEELPRELQKLANLEEKATYLRDNFCELDIGENGYLQWYVVRLEK